MVDAGYRSGCPLKSGEGKNPDVAESRVEGSRGTRDAVVKACMVLEFGRDSALRSARRFHAEGTSVRRGGHADDALEMLAHARSTTEAAVGGDDIDG